MSIVSTNTTEKANHPRGLTLFSFTLGRIHNTLFLCSKLRYKQSGKVPNTMS